MLDNIAAVLEIKRPSVENLVETVYEDPQVDFVWQLWLEAFDLAQPPVPTPTPGSPDFAN